ncbi:hypothetical protein DAERI_030134 [Deinococcus aerius]|uniref:DUF1540 domain-containing protein n=1 Tax=Deinococcus aerius TaxID=200253 RepID=A0A2I9DFU9_9DEIO|nr:DUF1540 domain-containing protein [Deinococcus aerius]GBF04968.1 hypothetical protein DAERI_030134 [Deinococcus aerius]
MNDMRNMQGEGQKSVVSRCGATNCRYNENEQCMAGQIEVNFSGQMAQCLTFSPEDQMGDTQTVGEGAH